MQVIDCEDPRSSPASHADARSALRSSLNELSLRMADSEADLRCGHVDAAMRRLVDVLAVLRSRLPAERWRALCSSAKLRPMRALLHQDPHAQRAYAKPRGYAGDPVLLDYVYGCAPVPDQTTRCGRDIYRWAAAHSSAFRSVRQRRTILSDVIDLAAARRPGARVLALACGHLREAQLSFALCGRAISELVAIDHDPLSLEVVRASFAGLPVRGVQGTLGELIGGRIDVGEFDLIYAAGLYDYLPDTIARRLTTVLCSRLAMGGELVVGNFVRCWEAAYMEAIMDWFLVYRSEAGLLSLADDVSDCALRTWTDGEGVVGYLAVTRC